MTEPQSFARLATAGPHAPYRGRRELTLAPALAAALAGLAVLIGLHGVDLPAQLYRVDLFQRSGITLWDSQWYGGHWTLNYSVVFPPLAGVLGIGLTEVLSAGLAAWMFDRLVRAHFGPSARFGAYVFALGTLAQVAIGQLPFLLGESLALCACWMAMRRRWWLGGGFALITALASPLAGAFLALALLSGLVARLPRLRLELLGLAAAAGLPTLALSVLFPGQGVMPFPAADFAWALLIFAAAAALVPARHRALRTGAGLYVVAILVSFAAATPVGGNVTRLGECVGAPLLICLAWSRQRRIWRLAAIVVAIAITTLQWGPALASLRGSSSDPSVQAAYFRPLIGFLERHSAPLGRVEVVPTKRHWEAAYVAPTIPLARGWERQLDTADNPLFYGVVPLTAAEYRAWLLGNGARYVALADVPVDFAARREAALIRAGVPGLVPVWHDAHWHVWAVRGSTGIVAGPARLVSVDGGQLVLKATRPGAIEVRERFSPGWRLAQGNGCVRSDANGWTEVDASSPGPLRLAMGLGSVAQPDCPTA